MDQSVAEMHFDVIYGEEPKLVLSVDGSVIMAGEEQLRLASHCAAAPSAVSKTKKLQEIHPLETSQTTNLNLINYLRRGREGGKKS